MSGVARTLPALEEDDIQGAEQHLKLARGSFWIAN